MKITSAKSRCENNVQLGKRTGVSIVVRVVLVIDYNFV